MLTSNCAASVIDKSFRIIPTSATTLDHILTNENRFELFPAVIQYELTDHYQIRIAVYRRLPNTHIHETVNKALTNFSSDAFNENLQENLCNFFSKITSKTAHNLNNIFNEFYFLVSQTIDQHAQILKLNRKKLLHINTWITKELLIPIKKKKNAQNTLY